MISFILLLLTAIGLFYLFIKHRYLYWARLNVPYLEPTFPRGNAGGIDSKKHSTFHLQDNYNALKGKGPFGGIFFFIQPVVVPTDLEFIKNILVKDFQYFYNRGVYHNEKDDPLTGHLFNLEDQRWKNLRAKLSPTFTSGKMKFMFPTIAAVGEEFVKCIEHERKQDGGIIEMKEILARFTTDVIGTCAFGIESNSLKDPTAIFREMGRKSFIPPKYFRTKIMFAMTFPDIARKLGITMTRPDVEEFFMGAVRDTITLREKNKIQRNDFMDLLIQLKNQETDGLTFKEIAAQAFVFFLAGFETSSTAMSFALYELSLNHEIQQKAREEVEEILKKYNGEWTYEGMMEMNYVEQIVNESLRKYPPVGNHFRTVTKDYKDPISGVVLKKGLRIMISAYGIQHDPEYYPNPEEFNPDRFSPEEVAVRNPMTFLPFGEGPRICIGLRFGMVQAKIGLSKLLANYKFTTCEKSIVPLEFSPKAFVLASVGGLYLKVEKCDS